MAATGFAVIPPWVLHDPKLSPNAKLLAGRITALCQRDNRCWATNAFFAEEFGVTERSIQRLVTELLNAGHFTRSVVKHPKGSERVLSMTFDAGRGDRNVTPGVTRDDTPGVTKMSPGGEEGSKEVRELTLFSDRAPSDAPPPPTRQPYPDHFEQVWKIHPRGSKSKAYDEYRKAVFSNGRPARVTHRDLVDLLTLYVDTEIDERFKGHDLFRWIRDDRWEQEREKGGRVSRGEAPEWGRL